MINILILFFDTQPAATSLLTNYTHTHTHTIYTYFFLKLTFGLTRKGLSAPLLAFNGTIVPNDV